MSIFCGLECVVCLGCSRWAWTRCTHNGSADSVNWPPATIEEFSPIPRILRVILAVYESDLNNPKFAPPSGQGGINRDWVVKRVSYSDTAGNAPPYLIYVDRDAKDVILAIRGLNLKRESDYFVLLDNRLGQNKFAGGYVHNGLLKSASWVLNHECEELEKLMTEHTDYTLTFTGHSLGSGIAALMTLLVVNDREGLGTIVKGRVRGYAVAPTRCMSLNLAVKYADVINSVILQDDFLPRTATPLEDIFKSIFCLPCLLFLVCMRDTFISDDFKLKDTRRLYAPGRMYHIVERKFCRCGRFPPEVKTAIPVDGRFEHIILSCNATSDHGILWIEKEAQKALDLMQDQTTMTPVSMVKKFERQKTIEEEHKSALERAVSLHVPGAGAPEEEVEPRAEAQASEVPDEITSEGQQISTGRTNWNALVERLFNKDKSGKLILKKSDEEDDQ